MRTLASASMSVTLDLRTADADASVLHSASGYHRSNHIALGPALAPGQPVEYCDRDGRGDDAQASGVYSILP